MRIADVRCDDFSDIFRANLKSRSRTAKGISDTGTSKTKKKLLKEGEELVRQVEENTQALIGSVWANRLCAKPSPNDIRRLCELWYDLINRDLQLPDAYVTDQQLITQRAGQLAKAEGLPHRINSRYRVWNVSYTTIRISPEALEVAMDGFYAQLSKKILDAREGVGTQAELLAFADHTIDEEIHPWLDGCGRNATTVIMWLSLLREDFQIPRFGTREEHYATIRDPEKHADYFQRCFER